MVSKTDSYIGKGGMLCFSVTQIGFGIYLSVGGSNSRKLGGGALISSGISSGLYACQEDKNEVEYKEYVKQGGYGFLSGIIAGGFGKWAEKWTEKAGALTKIGWQVLGSATSSATSTALSEVVESIEKQTELTFRATLNKATHKATSGGIGGGVGALMNAALTSKMVNDFVKQLMEKLNDNAKTSALVLKKMMESSVSSGSSKFAADLCENLQEKDLTKKKKLRTRIEEACQSAAISAIIGGITTCIEQRQKIQEYNQMKEQIGQTQKDIKDAEAQKTKSQEITQELEKFLEQSKQNLVEKQEALKLQKQSLHEKKVEQQKTEEQVGKDQQAISEAQEIDSTAEKDFRVAKQSLMEAQQQVEKYQQAVSEAQETTNIADQELQTTLQTAQRIKQANMQLVDSIDKDIQYHLRRGFEAKVGSNYLNNEEQIRNAYLQGDRIKWKKGQNRFFGSRKTSQMESPPFMEKHQQAQEHAKQIEKKIQELQPFIKQKQTELKIAQDKFDLHHQAADQAQAKLNAQEVQLKQTELKIVQDQLRSHQNEIQQVQQDIANTQKAVKTSKQQADQFETKLQDELKKLQAILDKESDLATLSREQQATINKLLEQAVRQYLPLLNRGTLKKALKPEPVSYVEADCSLEELIPHVVLVHALNHQSPPESMEIEMVDIEDEEKRIIFYTQKVVTSEGVIGSHVELKRIEFGGSLPDRPHLHWSWNQLVQPAGAIQHDGTPINSWEKAKIAFLEPLSTFENGVYYKPFGVTPYDTFTFNSHRFSDKSILLVPQSLGNKVQMHLSDFRGRIVTFNDSEVLRSVIIDTLQKYYPETWHICDEKGNLTGKKTQYSPGGYSSQTCIKRTDGQVIVLMNNSGVNPSTDHKSEAIKEYHKNQRFIGLHVHSITFWIEDKNNAYFDTLKRFKENHNIVKGHSLFAGNIGNVDELAQLGALEALRFYQKLLKYDSKTGIIEVANYIINEAIYADLVSLFYQMNPASKFDLSILDLKMIFESIQIYLLNLLEDIKINIEAKDPDQRQRAMDFFESKLNSEDASYCSILKRSIIDMQKSKKEALRKLSKVEKKEAEGSELEKKTKPLLCLSATQGEWEKIETPSDSIEFDLGKNWPHSDQLRDYANKVLRTLPTDPEKLQQLHQQLSSYSCREIRNPEERKEQYRLNIVCNIIQWALQEKIYLASRKEYNVNSSSLANKLSKQIGWLAEYGLETEDCTLNIGDCLFDNIIAQLPSNMLTSPQLRKELVQYMQKHSEAYSKMPDYNENELTVGDGQESVFFENWEQYLTCMSRSQVWGTELEIQALASYLNCPIALLTVGMRPKIYNRESKNIPLFLHHLHANHFEACIPFKALAINDVYHGIKNQTHY